MIDLKTRILTIAAAGALLLGTLVNPAFAASTIHVEASANETNFPFSGKPVWFFEHGNFNAFFSNFFSKRFRANMDGAQEIPGPGDVDGRGQASVRIKVSDSELCADIEADYIDPATAAHIHHAPAGSAGAVVVNLPIPNEEGEAEGCMSVDKGLLEKIKDNPQDYYINIHNNPYPNGAIRGQLSK